MKNRVFVLWAALMFLPFPCGAGSQKAVWGFYGHRQINRLAVFTLPPALFPFFKKHIGFLEENAVNPDQRRYAVEGEAPKHYIDLDVYGPKPFDTLPQRWKAAVERFGEDSLKAYGTVPWSLYFNYLQLKDAFEKKQHGRILRLAADLGHYAGDANVPLHTTENYNGQLSGQHGIHALWESRLPELFSVNYDFFTGRAEYVADPQARAWEAVREAHAALDSVLRFEKELTVLMGEETKWAYETRNGANVKAYSKEFSAAYHLALAGQVERRMRASVKLAGDLWFTAWVDAGQPDLNAPILENGLNLLADSLEQEKSGWQKVKFPDGRGEH